MYVAIGRVVTIVAASVIGVTLIKKTKAAGHMKVWKKDFWKSKKLEVASPRSGAESA